MRLSLLIVCSLLCKIAAGQVVVYGKKNPFSPERIKIAGGQLKASKSPYKVVYMASTPDLLRPAEPIPDAAALPQLPEEQVARDASALQTAFDAQQKDELDKAKTYFDKLNDKAHTILVLDIFSSTIDKAGVEKYLPGKKFLFGDEIGLPLQQMISAYNPATATDLFDDSHVKNDKYLDEYISYLSSTIEERYPRAFPIVVMISEFKGYLHTDPAGGLTAKDLDELKKDILTTYPTSIKSLELLPIDYNFKAEQLQFSKAILMYAYKRNKDSPYTAASLDLTTKSWTLNNKKLNSHEGKTQLVLNDPNLNLVDGENQLQVISDMAGETRALNKITSIFNVKINYNAGNYFLKVAINKQAPQEVQLGKSLGTADGGGTLKTNDNVDLYLFKKTEKGEEAIKNAIWDMTTDKKVSDHISFKIIGGDIKLTVQPSEDANARLIQVAYEKVVPPAEAYSFSALNTTALKDEDSRSIAKSMFKQALETIKSSSAELYNYFVAQNGIIQSYALPSGDPKLKLEADNLILNGFADRGADYTSLYNNLDIIDIKKKGKIVADATLVTRLSGNDKRTLLNASADPNQEGKAIAEPVVQKVKDDTKQEKLRRLVIMGTITDPEIAGFNFTEDDIAILKKAAAAKTQGKIAADPIIDRIGKTNPTVAAKLRQLVTTGTLKEEDVAAVYELIPDNATVLSKYFNVMNTRKQIYLNYDALVDKPEEAVRKAKFTGITAHEMMHVYYGVKNNFSILKWAVIRDKVGGDESIVGHSDCSAGPGHERYNKENDETCKEQRKYYKEDTKPLRPF